MQMRRITLEIELVTPTFLGGSDSGKSCEWRASSVRGQLRWWFRAVAGGMYQGDLDRVRQAEEEIFGSTKQASSLRVHTLGSPRIVQREVQSWGRGLGSEELARTWGLDPRHPDWDLALRRLRLPWPTNPLLYLGYGCLEYRKEGGFKLARPCFEPGEKASLRLQWMQPPSSELNKLWDLSLWTWLHLGGIGTRSRRGFGSIRLNEGGDVPDQWKTGDRGSFKEGVERLLRTAARPISAGELPAWSHFCAQSTIYLAKGAGYRTWDDAMTHVGAWLMSFRRRYGSQSDSRKSPRRPLADRDYKWAKEAGRNVSPVAVPDRAGFGLSLPFGKKSEQIVSWGDYEQDNRRASPLLIHIARFGSQFVPILTHLPAKLVPDGKQVRFRGLHRPSHVPSPEQQSIVGEFLTDLASRNLVERIVP